jgi:hypothetical protein
MTQTLSVSDHDVRIAEIAGNLAQLFEPGQVVELRVLGNESAQSGFFDDWQAVAAHALAAELEGRNVYFGLAPRILHRCLPDNELCPGKAAGAQDVLERRWLLLDFDPVRPPDTASTSAEKRAARSVMEMCIRWLSQDQGWPPPLLGDSGNGWHALYRVDLPAADGGLVQRVEAALRGKFATGQVKIDSMFDPPRICRLYGTLNRKGEPSTERPHRRSRLYGSQSGQARGAVPPEFLERVAALAPTPPPAPKQGAESLAIATGGSAPTAGRGVAYKLARRWLSQQPDAIDGQVNDQGRTGGSQTFYIAAELQRGWGLSRKDAWRLLVWYNKHKCKGPWDKKGLRHKLDEGTKAAREAELEKPGFTGWRARRRTTVVVDTDEHRVSAEAEAALHSAPGLYQYSEALVNVRLRGGDDKTEALVQRHPATAVIRALTKALLRDELSRQVKFVKLFKGKQAKAKNDQTAKTEPTSPDPAGETKSQEPQPAAPCSDTGVKHIPAHVPGFVVNTIYDRGQWRSVPMLRGVAAHPVILDTGCVLATKGFHAQSGLFLWLPQTLGLTVQDSPTSQDARAAVAALLDPVRDFPFASPEHQAAWVAALLTPWRGGPSPARPRCSWWTATPRGSARGCSSRSLPTSCPATPSPPPATPMRGLN